MAGIVGKDLRLRSTRSAAALDPSVGIVAAFAGGADPGRTVAAALIVPEHIQFVPRRDLPRQPRTDGAARRVVSRLLRQVRNIRPRIRVSSVGVLAHTRNVEWLPD